MRTLILIKMRTVLVGFSLVFLLGCSLNQAPSQEVKKQIPQFSYDQDEFPGVKPWTSEEFLNNPEDFQFAVIGDRTGGADARGVFNRAMDQLNLLQPEFVINVGDVIEGYTDDREKLNKMWEEAEAMINKLEMPFFYTVGNHDLNNEVMKEVWLERRGADYYHFIYGDVLFLVLNSEDPPNAPPEDLGEKIETYNRLQVEDPEKAKKMLDEFMAKVDESFRLPANFSDEQIAYVKKVLEKNSDVRWTFIFLHQPSWEMPGEGFLKIEEMLKDRDYTFIAGHMHYYKYEQRNGHDYITVGPAGASMHHEGPGNVDHVLWITMKDEGPEIAQITLEGLFDRKGRVLEMKEMYDRTNK